MRFLTTTVPPVTTIDLEPLQDERGWFSRTYCAREFPDHGLLAVGAQTNLSYNRLAGTLRGLHYQREPAQEAKLVRCVRGSVFDVAVDVRPESPTYLRWVGSELSEDNARALYVPEGFAHGFLTLSDDALVIYQVSEFYTPATEGGLRFDDPAIGIEWPAAVRCVSTKDASWPMLEEAFQ